MRPPERTVLLNNRVTLAMPRDPFAGLSALLGEYQSVRNALQAVVPRRFPVGMPVLVPGTYSHAKGLGIVGGVVDGYHGSEPDAVWVRLDGGREVRRALVPAAELIRANS